MDVRVNGAAIAARFLTERRRWKLVGQLAELSHTVFLPP